MNAFAGQDVSSKKEKRYVGNYFDRRRALDVIWRTAHLASQPAVGVLPEWRTWPDPFDCDNSASAGPDLGGRNVSYQPQKMVQCGFASMELGAGYFQSKGSPAADQGKRC